MKILSLLVVIASFFVPSLRSKSVSDPTDISVLSVPDRVIGGMPNAGVTTG